MKGALQRKTVFIGTTVVIFAMVAGFALASVGVLLTHHTQNAQGDSVATSGAVSGVAYVSTVLNVTDTNSMTVQTALGTPTAPVSLAAHMNAFCMSGSGGSSACTDGDFSEWVNYSFSTSFSGAMQVTMYMGNSNYNTEQTLYVKQAATAVAGNVLLIWDLGTGTQTLTGITVTLTQCSGASSCP